MSYVQFGGMGIAFCLLFVLSSRVSSVDSMLDVDTDSAPLHVMVRFFSAGCGESDAVGPGAPSGERLPQRHHHRLLSQVSIFLDGLEKHAIS